MKKTSKLFIAAVLAVLISVAAVYRIYTYRTHFDAVVAESLEISDGYDQAFIDMVIRLEDELATRASFGYIGEKDPMTGQKRTIVKPKKVVRVRRYSKKAPAKPVDPFRLSAIIFNDLEKKFTAIMMLGERSLAVEIGDNVGGRKVRKISKGSVEMSDATHYYYYDIEGKKERKPLNSSAN